MAIEFNGLNTNATNTNRSGSGQAVNAPKPGAAAENVAKAKSGGDTVQISAQAQTLNRVSNQIGKEAPVNREKVEAIKTAIANGTYKTNAQAIAQRLLDGDTQF